MAFVASSMPAFGKADLSNCEREQVHLAGSIQPFGALLVLSEPGLLVVQASDNAQTFLGLDRSPVGLELSALPGNLLHRVRPHLDEPLTDAAIGVRCTIGQGAEEFDGLVHRPKGGGLVIELERVGPNVDLSLHVQQALTSMMACSSLRPLCDEAARVFRQLTGYDRVMVYRFDEQGHGQILAERKKAQLESFLGNWYPASDIPQIARRLYEINRVRILIDVSSEASPLVPRLSPISGQDLDMSLCVLRSMSPLHIQYLKNMGVAATLVVSLMVGGRLWGLIACHHYGPRFAHFEVRAVCELLAEALATRIAALDAFVQAQAEISVRRLEQRMVDTISREGDWRAALFDRSQAILTLLDAQGAALLLDDDVQTVGDVPSTQSIRAVRGWLKQRDRARVILTTSLVRDIPELVGQMPGIGGLLAVPISDIEGDYLIWFRPERIKTVTWGGNPSKPFTVGDNPLDLSPRRSFAKWHELVEGTCESWSVAAQATGRMIGEMVADVVLQFRTVGMLIVQNQLDNVSRQVQSSEQPIMMFDAHGRALLANPALRKLLGGRAPPEKISDFAAYFAQPMLAEQKIGELVRHRRPWRDEAFFVSGNDADVPLLVRADPVMSAPGRVLGFVFLFLDISERKSVEAARARFLQDVIAPHRFAESRIGAASEPMFAALMSIVVENAQLAALEVTDGHDTGGIPRALDAIQSSVDRAAAVLERLIWHASRTAANDT
ncbi:GAF domain-containing protein [Lichenifustis flavocetrariae]|uniref:GAF domain-containing protein n=1 Tax=Lichenifustis flavocetrariae TaxID=2949735 RepID=A0AA42CHI1_9HYPH|nr:GAF domain-containing protein [Lichenifustis flavocetrariae]MCW6507294.1 GAF domain-containing protein [Lichenifustis flavocetrariae]